MNSEYQPPPPPPHPDPHISTKCQADLWPFIQGHSFGLSHTYLNIFSLEITRLFDVVLIRFFLGHLTKMAATPIKTL